MGRETFMLPVTWKDNQPIILPEGDVITYTADRSYGPAPLWTANGLAKEAFFIRTPLVPCYDINSKGQLEMTASSTDLNQKRQPAAIGRWINNWTFTAQTGLDFVPQQPKDFAGIICFHDDNCYIRFGKTLDKDDKPVIFWKHTAMADCAAKPAARYPGQMKKYI